jgi:ketosteroid isomerase-like protein
MKNKIILGLSLGCIFILVNACDSKKEEASASTVDKEKIKAEIQAMEDSFAQVYNSGELKNIGYYADDAQIFFQNRPPVVGKDSILSFLKSDMISKNDSLTFKTNEVFVSNDGNQVVEIGSFRLIDSIGGVINSGNFMSLFEKRDGKYVSTRDMIASDLPPKQ